MKSLSRYYVPFVKGFFILLFTYAAVSKLLDFENFQVQLAQSPLLSAYAGFVSYAVLALEFGIVLLLTIPKTGKTGIYASFGLMVAFTVYIWLILTYSDFVPCSCGGILEKMGWTEHLMFNIGCVVLAATAVFMGGVTSNSSKRKYLMKQAGVLGILSITSAGLMIGLFFTSEQIMKKENPFVRRFIPHGAVMDKTFDLGVNSYYFAGQNKSHLYLGNRTSPGLLVLLDQQLTFTQNRYIHLDREDILFSSPQLQTKYNAYFLYDGKVPVVLRGELGHERMKTVSYKELFFTELSAIDSARFAVKYIDAKTKQFTIGLISVNEDRRLSSVDRLLADTAKSLFESDGWLSTDSTKIVYAYTYLNRFSVTDVEKKENKEFKTIDPGTTAELQIVKLKNGDKKIKSPPPKINKRSKAFSDVLFIQSDRMGKLESKKLRREYAVMDMYSTDNGEYLGSFYLYYRGSKNLTDFILHDNYLYVMVDQSVIRFQLSASVTDHFRKGKPKTLNRVGNNK